MPRARGGAPIQYVQVTDRRTLAWCANLAAIELHPFLHRAPALDTPTMVVFDLDPGDGTDVLDCAEVAGLVRDKLERLGLRAFVKVSGSKGLQVYVPLNTPVSYRATGAFARTLARLLEREHPRGSRRRGKVFIDWSQNAPHKTTVAALTRLERRGDLFGEVLTLAQALPAAFASIGSAPRRQLPHGALRRG